ncbi:MAG: SpoIID/LytB domain-containing protein, partial [Egicoccus sp.]
MSQYGAYAMARAGRDVGDILDHYYGGTVEEWRTTDRPVRVGICLTPSATCQPVSATWVTAVSADVRWDTCPNGTGAAPADGVCERGTREGGQVQTRGTTWYVCPEVVAGVSQQRVQDRRCGTAGAVTHFTTTQPVIRVHHSSASTGSTVQIEVPGPGHDVNQPRDGQKMTVLRGTHDIIRTATGPANSLVRVQNLRSVQEYLYGIAEVPASWGPNGGTAALEAQAVTARTYGLRTFADRGHCRCDIFATPSHQAYNGRAPEVAAGGAWKAAVDATFRPDTITGQVLTYGGQLAQTFYSSSHGGRTENSEDSWAFSARLDYLRSVDDPWSLDPTPCPGSSNPCNPYRWWRATASNAGVAALVSETPAGTVATVERLAVLSRSDGGTPAVLRVTGRTAAGERVTFDYAGTEGTNPKNAGSRVRLALPTVLTARADGRTAALVRPPSSQISRFSYAPFDDDDGNVHEYAIVWADRAGVVNGQSPTSFAPDARLRRDQMATLLFNTFDVP